MLELIETPPKELQDPTAKCNESVAEAQYQFSTIHLDTSNIHLFVDRKLSKVFHCDVIKQQCLAIASVNANMAKLAKESTLLLTVLEKLDKNTLRQVSTKSIMCK